MSATPDTAALLDALSHVAGWSIESANILPGRRHTLVITWPDTDDGLARAKAVLMAVQTDDEGQRKLF